MSTSNSKSAGLEFLRRLIKEEVEEAIRTTGGTTFDIREFRTITNPDKAYEYAEQRLKLLGEGSSRAVFLFSSGKVLKIAHGKRSAGKAQNESEVDVFTDPRSKPVVAKVFDYGKDFTWLISELVHELDDKVIASRFGEEWTAEDYMNILRQMIHSHFSKQQFIKDIDLNIRRTHLAFDKWEWIAGLPVAKEDESEIEKIREKLQNDGNVTYDEMKRALEATVMNNPKLRANQEAEYRKREANMIRVAELRKKSLNSLLSSVETLATGLRAMEATIGFNLDDIIYRPGHLGVTTDGRIVVLDYGYTEEIGDKFYTGNEGTPSNYDSDMDDSESEDYGSANSGRSF